MTMLAEVHVIDRSALYAVIGTALQDLREVGVIVGDIDVADEQIVSAIQARWTVFTDSHEVPHDRISRRNVLWATDGEDTGSPGGCAVRVPHALLRVWSL
ncbi:hypothetical protein [Nocardia sp. NPDC046763]|uniref:hypothetical protein n=1 Tax=Nocardia sp. NPDC046763 TaxID=3155256 RepID=UPI0033D0B662